MFSFHNVDVTRSNACHSVLHAHGIAAMARRRQGQVGQGLTVLSPHCWIHNTDRLVRNSPCCLRIAGFTTPTGWLGTHRAVSALLYFRVSATPRLISFITCVAFCNNHCMLHQNANICHKKIQFSPDNEFHGCDKLTIAIIMSTYVVGCGHLKQKQNNTFTMCNVITILIRVVRLLHELIKLANRINTGENHAIGMSTIFIVVFFFNCNR